MPRPRVTLRRGGYSHRRVVPPGEPHPCVSAHGGSDSKMNFLVPVRLHPLSLEPAVVGLPGQGPQGDADRRGRRRTGGPAPAPRSASWAGLFARRVPIGPVPGGAPCEGRRISFLGTPTSGTVLRQATDHELPVSHLSPCFPPPIASPCIDRGGRPTPPSWTPISGPPSWPPPVRLRDHPRCINREENPSTSSADGGERAWAGYYADPKGSVQEPCRPCLRCLRRDEAS